MIGVFYYPKQNPEAGRLSGFLFISPTVLGVNNIERLYHNSVGGDYELLQEAWFSSDIAIDHRAANFCIRTSLYLATTRNHYRNKIIRAIRYGNHFTW